MTTANVYTFGVAGMKKREKTAVAGWKPILCFVYGDPINQRRDKRKVSRNSICNNDNNS